MTPTRIIVNIIVAPLVLIAAILIAVSLVRSKKTPPPRVPKVVVARVDIFAAAPATFKPQVRTYGNTRSHMTTALASQVRGEILRISPAFEVGKLISKGDWLVEINPVDMEAISSERQSALAKAQQALADEQTRSTLAQEDWIASGRKLEEANDFTLRKPQLLAAKAAVKAAESSAAKAKLDVARSTVLAPFDAIVQSRTASPGNVVMIGNPLGNLLSREKIEVRLPLTPQQVRSVDLSKISSTPLVASITTPTLPGKTWKAKISRIEPAVDTRNQTLWVIGEIEDPFSDTEAFLPVGAFVHATFDALSLEDVYIFPEVTVVEDSFVWVVSPSATLIKQPVDLVYTQSGTILVRIAAPLFPLPLKVVKRPLASFRAEQPVESKPVVAMPSTPASGVQHEE
jgi:RND family efflux transporter MFP subunit